MFKIVYGVTRWSWTWKAFVCNFLLDENVMRVKTVLLNVCFLQCSLRLVLYDCFDRCDRHRKRWAILASSFHMFATNSRGLDQTTTQCILVYVSLQRSLQSLKLRLSNLSLSQRSLSRSLLSLKACFHMIATVAELIFSAILAITAVVAITSPLESR